MVNSEFGLLAQELNSDNTAIDISLTTGSNEIVTINAIYASFDSSVAAAELTIEEDSTVVFKKVFDDTINIEPSIAISFSKGADINVKLTASGGAGTSGNVVVVYNKQSVGQ